MTQKEKVRELRLQGKCGYEICKETGIKPQNVKKIVKDLGMRYTAEEIERSKKLFYDERRKPSKNSHPRGYKNNEIYELHRAGLTPSEIATAIGFKQPHHIAAILRRKGINPNKRRKAQGNIELIEICRNQGMLYKEISEYLGLPVEYVKRTCSAKKLTYTEKEKAKLSFPSSSHNRRYRFIVPLDKLAERDNNICYICGKEIDWNDYKKTRDGWLYFGNNYPSRDHVIPRALGGADTWENIKLAHRGCNIKKGTAVI